MADSIWLIQFEIKSLRTRSYETRMWMLQNISRMSIPSWCSSFLPDSSGSGISTCNIMTSKRVYLLHMPLWHPHDFGLGLHLSQSGCLVVATKFTQTKVWVERQAGALESLISCQPAHRLLRDGTYYSLQPRDQRYGARIPSISLLEYDGYRTWGKYLCCYGSTT